MQFNYILQQVDNTLRDGAGDVTAENDGELHGLRRAVCAGFLSGNVADERGSHRSLHFVRIALAESRLIAWRWRTIVSPRRSYSEPRDRDADANRPPTICSPISSGAA